MSVSKNTLRNWLKKGKKHLDSLIPVLKESALEKDAIVNCDETWCKVRRFNKYTILDEELRKDNEFRSSYMMQALSYLDHFGDELFLYRKDGSYPIDNNLAERSVRPFTTKRKCSLHFGSDEGAEMSAVYHSIISTLKLCGKSVWNFFGEYFRCEVLGQDTYKEYLPALSR